LLLLMAIVSEAQVDRLQNVGGRMRQFGNRMSGGSNTDSLKRRDVNEDSLTIRFRYLDSTRLNMLDSSINDFTKRTPMPSSFINLGNTGTAARNLLFDPYLEAGWDAGFHAFDIYKLTLKKI